MAQRQLKRKVLKALWEDLRNFSEQFLCGVAVGGVIDAFVGESPGLARKIATEANSAIGSKMVCSKI